MQSLRRGQLVAIQFCTQVVRTLRRAQNICWGKRRRNSQEPETEVCQGKREHGRPGPARKPAVYRVALETRATRQGGREQGLEPAPRGCYPTQVAAKARRPPVAVSPSPFPRNLNQKRGTTLAELLPGLSRSPSPASVRPLKPSDRAPELKGGATQGTWSRRTAGRGFQTAGAGL